jgi:hypothetical protein
MPGAVRFTDPKANVEGDLLGELVLDAENKLVSVIPLTGTTDGQWIQTKSYDKICVGIIVDTSATLIICGSMAVAKPSDSANDGVSLFGTKVYAAAAEEILAIKTPVRWLKVKVTANGGLVSAPFVGV